MIDPVSLSSLVQGLSSIAGKTATTAEEAAKSAGPSFVDVLKNTASDMFSDLKSAETMSYKGVEGKASTREVVDAVMNADRSLQTAIAIRDKVVSAYLDITKMPI
ncbi:flagellar hook-basal body complex protein FliE [Ensifer adhaerens]|nr:flagellar hook-basal body complex protein FliE [Ensifer adhaerens]HZG29665.1 flagellar hook-basal body complex protein FliE [Ensifer sp.]